MVTNTTKSETVQVPAGGTNKRTTPNYSPENDISKAIELLRNARAKFIRQGNEARAARMLQAITDLQTE